MTTTAAARQTPMTYGNGPTVTQEVFTEEEVRDLLRCRCIDAGSQAAFSREHALPKSHVNEVINGKRPVNQPITRILGLEVVWRKRA